MKIAVEGCAHGELEKIYETILFLEEKEGIKVDLLICCGDFQVSLVKSIPYFLPTLIIRIDH